MSRCTFVDTSRTTQDYVTGATTANRTLVTDIFFPSLAGAVPGAVVPAEKFGPFPTIVFSGGYGVDPTSYAALLDAWVRAHFVVVAPISPDASAAAVAAIGHSFADEADIPNEPEDLVVTMRDALKSSTGRSTSCKVLRGLIDPSELGVAGQSDGATVAAMLGYDSSPSPLGTTSFRDLDAGLDVRAIAVLSGSAYADQTYGATPTSPALLVVQSATDTCNTPAQAVGLYSSVIEPDRWFLALRNALHLTPYEGQAPRASALVKGVTTAFFADELRGVKAGSAFLHVGNAAPAVGALVRGPDLPSWLDADEGAGGVNCYAT